MSSPTHFLVAGGTGRQGSAVVEALLADHSTPISPERVHVITRNAAGPAALRLSGRSIGIIQGDLNTPGPILKYLEEKQISASKVAVFMAQAHGPTELSDAKGFVDTVSSAGVPYFVYSSVDRGGKELSDRDASFCKTFSHKYHIEKHLIAASEHATASGKSGHGMDYTILRPTWFADNADWGFAGRLCLTAWRDNLRGKRLQLVVTKDIGRWAAEALLRPGSAGLRNEALSVASDELSFAEMDDIFQQETGQAVGVTYGWLASLMVWAIKDLNTMFAWISEREYGANLEELQKTVPPTTFRTWAKTVQQRKMK